MKRIFPVSLALCSTLLMGTSAGAATLMQEPSDPVPGSDVIPGTVPPESHYPGNPAPGGPQPGQPAPGQPGQETVLDYDPATYRADAEQALPPGPPHRVIYVVPNYPHGWSHYVKAGVWKGSKNGAWGMSKACGAHNICNTKMAYWGIFYGKYNPSTLSPGKDPQGLLQASWGYEMGVTRSQNGKVVERLKMRTIVSTFDRADAKGKIGMVTAYCLDAPNQKCPAWVNLTKPKPKTF